MRRVYILLIILILIFTANAYAENVSMLCEGGANWPKIENGNISFTHILNASRIVKLNIENKIMTIHSGVCGTIDADIKYIYEDRIQAESESCNNFQFIDSNIVVLKRYTGKLAIFLVIDGETLDKLSFFGECKKSNVLF